MQKCCVASMFMAAILLNSGCQTSVYVKASPVKRLAEPKSAALCVLKEATDARSNKPKRHIGRQTFTIFMIPTISVQSEDLIKDAVGKVFVQALKESGYNVEVVTALDQSDGPVLVLQVDSIRNFLFSWLWPLGLTTGRSHMTPILYDNQGKILWKGDLCSGWGFCPSLVYMAGFETSLKSEMNSCLKQVIVQLNTSEFNKANKAPTE